MAPVGGRVKEEFEMLPCVSISLGRLCSDCLEKQMYIGYRFNNKQIEYGTKLFLFYQSIYQMKSDRIQVITYISNHYESPTCVT